MTKERTQMLSWDDSAPAKRLGFATLRLILGVSFGFRALMLRQTAIRRASTASEASVLVLTRRLARRQVQRS